MASEKKVVMSAAFAARLNGLLDERGVAQGAGRQQALAQMFSMTRQGARRWVLGLGLPGVSRMLAVAQAFDVNSQWLYHGIGPKRGEAKRPKSAIRPEVLELARLLLALPPPDYEQFAYRIKLAHEMRSEESIVATILLAHPEGPSYEAYEEGIRKRQRRR